LFGSWFESLVSTRVRFVKATRSLGSMILVHGLFVQQNLTFAALDVVKLRLLEIRTVMHACG
jgi:hypothetical protein